MRLDFFVLSRKITIIVTAGIFNVEHAAVIFNNIYMLVRVSNSIMELKATLVMLPPTIVVISNYFALPYKITVNFSLQEKTCCR